MLGLDQVNIIEDTESPNEIISKFSDSGSLRNELILLIGNVGAGKSTFTDYLREKALPEAIQEKTLWISLNLNNAPVNREEIYKWIKKLLIEKLIEAHPHIDLEEKEELLKIYGTELKALRKGPASFYEPGSLEYNKLFVEKLLELEKDIDQKSKALVRYLCTSRSKLLVVVLDNCDKRDAEEQLLMFEVASWLKEYYNCLVFLPLRDTTYNLYRKQKPLDTVIKDLVFKIDPPLLREVIIARVKYTLRILGRNSNTLSYVLPNGFKVEYPQSDQGHYLASIVRSLFENTYFNRIISGISGKDIRKGLEVFLDFCRSGHIDEAEILKMKKFGATYVLKNSLVSKVVLRGNLKYYSDDSSIIKNLFISYPDEDSLPNPFTRRFILSWLKRLYYIEGPSRVKSYHRAADLIRDLVAVGHNKSRVLDELNILVKLGLIVTESQRDYLEEESELISITSYGFVHLDLLTDLNYISACAEDVYYRETLVATEIFSRITGRKGYGHYSYETILANSEDLIDYLTKYKDEFLPYQANSLLNISQGLDDYSFDGLKQIIEKRTKNAEEFAERKGIEEYPSGKSVECEIVSIQNYGVFVEFDLEYSGLIHVSEFERYGKYIEDYELGDRILGEIIQYNSVHQRFNIKFIRDVE